MGKPDDSAKPKTPYVRPSLKKDQRLKKITEGIVVSIAGPENVSNDLPR